MSALAAYVRDGCHEVRRKLSLNVEVPLLDVRPLRYRLNIRRRLIVDSEGEESASTANTRVSSLCGWTAPIAGGNERLAAGENPGRSAFKGLGIGFVAIAVFEEDAITAADGHLAVAVRIPSESDARGGIE